MPLYFYMAPLQSRKKKKKLPEDFIILDIIYADTNAEIHL